MQSNNGIINSLQIPRSGKKIGHDIASGEFPLDAVVYELQCRKQLNFSFFEMFRNEQWLIISTDISF